MAIVMPVSCLSLPETTGSLRPLLQAQARALGRAVSSAMAGFLKSTGWGGAGGFQIQMGVGLLSGQG